jgi:hypothetical protein
MSFHGNVISQLHYVGLMPLLASEAEVFAILCCLHSEAQRKPKQHEDGDMDKKEAEGFHTVFLALS